MNYLEKKNILPISQSHLSTCPSRTTGSLKSTNSPSPEFIAVANCFPVTDCEIIRGDIKIISNQQNMDHSYYRKSIFYRRFFFFFSCNFTIKNLISLNDTRELTLLKVRNLIFSNSFLMCTCINSGFLALARISSRSSFEMK